MTRQERKIHEHVVAMINEIGLLRAHGIALDHLPQQLLQARALLHELDNHYTVKERLSEKQATT